MQDRVTRPDRGRLAIAHQHFAFAHGVGRRDCTLDSGDNPCQRRIVAGAPCDGDRVARGPHRRLPPGVRHFRGERREQHRTVAVVQRYVDRPLEHFDALVIDGAGPAREAAAVRQRGPHDEVGRAQCIGAARGIEQCFAVPGLARLLLGLDRDRRRGRPA